VIKAITCLLFIFAQPVVPAVPKPQTVILTADKVMLSTVLADLSKQTGVPITDKRGGPDVAITLMLKDAPYWQAIDAVADAASARVDINPRDGHISLLKRNEKEPSPAISREGLFRAAIKRISAHHDFDNGDSAYTALVEIAWEPRLLPLFLETSPRGFKVADINAKDLPVRQEGSTLSPVDGRASFVLELPLPAFDRSAPRIGQLQGSLMAIAPSRMLQLTCGTLDQLEADAKNSKSKTFGEDGMKCTIRKVVLADDRWSVQVALEYPPGGPAFESYQSWVVDNEMFLENKDGKRLASNSYVLDSSSARHAVLTYHFTDKNRGKPGDWKLLYRTPASLVEIPFSFSFKDVRLP